MERSAWGEVTSVRRYDEFLGISVSVWRSHIAAIDAEMRPEMRLSVPIDDEYQPQVGDQARVTIREGQRPRVALEDGAINMSVPYMGSEEAYRAWLLAVAAHGDQVDKAGRPYMEHPMRMMAVFTNPKLQAIAVLHDVLEDTDRTPEWLMSEGMSEEVVDAVVALTHLPGEKRVDYYARVKQNDLALRVKLADLDDNRDPRRMALLDQETRERLDKKYRQAHKILMANVPLIVCPRCGEPSPNPSDIENEYCGFCARYHDEMGDQPESVPKG